MTDLQQKIIKSLGSSRRNINSDFLLQQISGFPPPPANKKFYSGLLELFIHLSLNEQAAEQHWQNIFENQEKLSAQTGRDIGLHVALLDYFINQDIKLENPIFVEVHVFKEAEKMAMVDGLTGLFNRRYFDINIRKELKRSARYEKNLSLLMLDIDNFKFINDSKGHLFGDEVLKSFAVLLRESSREEDIACRYGGEEFSVILPETTGHGALTLAERLRNRIHNTDLFSENGITISGGIAPYPFCGKTAEELLENADRALYQAKFSGKDCNIISNSDDRRKRPRFNKTWQVSCVPLAEQFRLKITPKETHTQDVSLGGIRIELDEEFASGTELLLDLKLPNGRTRIIGKIAWMTKITEQRYSYGVQFTELKNNQIQMMMQLLPSDFFNPPANSPA